ncbi:hypothetical protein CEXT_527921 [Caerostris extrusa]|uniref:Uncharacterized protein n=1 Tax=Caerostris extrusa TaxID=172846 RepID=A0AAV4X8W3_CAEEX|nr:hypothetical protein CEXT_527921 [Caerostris extrusa]
MKGKFKEFVSIMRPFEQQQKWASLLSVVIIENRSLSLTLCIENALAAPLTSTPMRTAHYMKRFDENQTGIEYGVGVFYKRASRVYGLVFLRFFS